jgi:hypothetical protein
MDANGKVRHRKLATRYAERHGVSLQEAREALGVERVRTRGKDRWFRPI